MEAALFLALPARGGCIPRWMASEVAALYQKYGPAVYRRCFTLLRDREAARDATQEVFGKLLRDQERLAGRDDVLPWIWRVATNHCLNVRRNARRHGEQEMPDELPVNDSVGTDQVPERQLAQRVLSRFDAETQAVAVGVLVDGMEHQEVADVLGISRRTVLRKLDRFLVNARKYVQRSET
jgi:RNA polymerase sigma-70 factor (ECF subfamily)